MKKTRREMLKQFAQGKSCAGVYCNDCPLHINNKCLTTTNRLTRIGAMAILRMFPEKKKPLLSIGTKVRFDDGCIAKIESTTADPEMRVVGIVVNGTSVLKKKKCFTNCVKLVKNGRWVNDIRTNTRNLQCHYEAK